MATSNEVKEALKTAAQQISEYVKDASEMTVVTRFIELGGSEEKLAASSVVNFDGDCVHVIPVRRDANNNVIPDTGMIEVHERNVQATIEYRVRMMEQLLSILRGT